MSNVGMQKRLPWAHTASAFIVVKVLEIREKKTIFRA
jgi:hypothetical protein